MSLKIDRVQLEIIVQQDSARQKMIELEKDIKNASSKLTKLKKQFGDNSAEYKAQEQVVKKLKAEYDKLFEEIGIGKLSLKELGNRQRELNAILRNLDPSLPIWKQYNQQLKEVNARIRELRNEAKESQFSVSKLADGFNRYAAIGASVIASMTGVALTARKCVDEYAQMEEAQSQVIKYTGMTKEETDALNESFKQMDTRTPREELNRLAGEAGKLGISSRDQVLEFVEAADMINVALGEDLGEDAVKNIGKLSQMFGDGSRTLKEDMLAIGSAVNQVAQSSSASEPYLVEFTARMGGVAKQANLAVTDVMGFASALDQNMLRSEMASTALQGLILKIYQEPAKYAKLAGMDVQEFVNLVNTDVNEALLQFLGTLGKMGGMAQMSPILKEMKLSGAEAAGVISALAGNIEQVRREQENANKAFSDGTSIENEYAVQNNTVQAGLDKAKNKFKDVRIELGEQLLPVMKYMVTTGSLTVKSLSAIVSIMMKYRNTIGLLCASIAAYTLLTKAQTIEDKLSAFWKEKLVVAFNKLRAAAMRHPYIAVGAAVVALIGYIRDLNREMTTSQKIQNSLKQVSASVSEEVQKETNNLNALLKIARDKSLADDERRKAIVKLNELSPQYLGNLKLETIDTNEANEAIKRYTASIVANSEAKAINARLDELNQQKQQLAANPQDLSKWYDPLTTGTSKVLSDLERIGNAMRTLFMRGNLSGWYEKTGMEQDYATSSLEAWGQRYTSEMKSIDEEIKVLQAELQKTMAKVLNNDPVVTTTDGGQTDQATVEAVLKKQYQDRLNIIKEKYLNQQLTEEQYNKALYDAEVEYLASRKQLLEQYGQDSSEIQGQIYDKMIAEANRLYQEKKRVDTNRQTDLLGSLELDYQKEQSRLKQAYLDGDIRTQEDYQARMLEAERNYLKQRRDMLASFGMDTSSEDGRLQDMDLKDKESGRKQQRKSGLAEIANTKDLEQQLNLLQAMYDTDKISYEEYQEWKTRLAQEHEEKRAQLAQSAFDLVSQAASSAGQLIQALQNKEISQVESRYEKQIEAAKAAGKDTTKLEEEKEAAISAIKKKYADKQFAANVLQIISDTAVSVMRAWAELGPILGPIYAGLAAAQGAAQVVVAKQQRDEAKGLKSGGYSDEYVDGYTRKGNPNDVAGVIPVHKNEFVANHEAVANPAVKQFLDVFDVAQKRGTIRMLNTTQILEQVRTRSGRYSGGYTYDNSTRPSATISAELGKMTPEQRLQVIALLQENNRLLGILCNKELVVDPRKVRDGIKRVETLERNVSR